MGNMPIWGTQKIRRLTDLVKGGFLLVDMEY